MKLTPTDRYALELLRCGLNRVELAQAMDWPVSEARVFRERMKRLGIPTGEFRIRLAHRRSPPP